MSEAPLAVYANHRTAPSVFEKHVATLPDDQREILSFWFNRQTEENVSLTQLARQAGVSSTSLSRAFRGKYAADLGSLCVTLAAAKENLSISIANPDFIMTSLAKLVWEILDETRGMDCVTLAWGKKGIGKSTITAEYKRQHNHGKTHYHRCSPAMTFGQFVTSLAMSMGIVPRKHSHLRLRGEIIAKLSAGRRLLIIDEFHELFLKRERGTGVHAVLICEFLREIYDVAGCGLALFGTRAMLAEFIEGDHAGALEQLLDRAEDPIELPDKPTKEDAAAFIRHYGLDATFKDAPMAAAIVKDFFEAHGIRRFIRRLRGGAAYAARRKEKYSWDHFVANTARVASLNKKKK